MADVDTIEGAAALLAGARWGALATVNDAGIPLASQVAFAAAPAQGLLLMHLSDLAQHTHNLLAQPAVSLVLGERDLGIGDPQTLARVTFSGPTRRIAPDELDYPALKCIYLERFPDAQTRFEFADFNLYAVRPTQGHYIGGFANAHRLDAAQSRAVIASSSA